MIRFIPNEYPDMDAMTSDQLKECFAELNSQIEALDAQEPADMDSDAYEAWADAHEVLEDLLDDIRDRLDELEG